jgi:hypothetical protein
MSKQAVLKPETKPLGIEENPFGYNSLGRNSDLREQAGRTDEVRVQNVDAFPFSEAVAPSSCH